MWKRTRDGSLPPNYYVIGLGGIVLALAAALWAFSDTGEGFYTVLIAVGAGLVFLGLPGILTRINDFTGRRRAVRRDDDSVETETGPVRPRTARYEVFAPLLGVAVGILVLAGVFVFVR